MQHISHIEEDAWLVGEFLLLNAKSGTVALVIDVREVGGGGALTYTTELVVDGTVAKADPSLVSTQIWDRNAAKMSADSGDCHKLGVSSIRDLEL